MMLLFPDGQAFATGMSRCEFKPTSPNDANHRLFCHVRIEGIDTEAALDTGGIYFICHPELAREISPTAEGNKRILIRGEWITGTIERHDLTFVSEEGQDLTIDAQIFLPNEGEEEDWPTFMPSFFGLAGCLEYIRFAIDLTSEEEMFYFGKYGDE